MLDGWRSPQPARGFTDEHGLRNPNLDRRIGVEAGLTTPAPGRGRLEADVAEGDRQTIPGISFDRTASTVARTGQSGGPGCGANSASSGSAVQ